MIYKSITQLIGRTPLLELERFGRCYGLKARVLAKLEAFNPTGSVKDRAAYGIVMDAVSRGLLKEGSVIIEPTSGNMGIGLAAVAATMGFKAILVMPDSMSAERRKILLAYGAQLRLTPGEQGMRGAIELAEKLAREIPGAFLAGQFYNMANPAAHTRTTGPEIWEDTGGEAHAFIAGVGTGGTITGAGGYLKERRPDIEIIAVEPAESPVLSGGQSGPHGLQGIGAGFIPDTLDTDIYDKIITVTSEQAIEAARAFARHEGFLAGISSGAALWAAVQTAREPRFYGKTIVALLPDTGERYLSCDLFTEHE